MKTETLTTFNAVDHRFDDCLLVLAKTKSYYLKYGKRKIKRSEFDLFWLELKAIYLEMEEAQISGNENRASELLSVFYNKIIVILREIGVDK